MRFTIPRDFLSQIKLMIHIIHQRSWCREHDSGVLPSHGTPSRLLFNSEGTPFGSKDGSDSWLHS